MVFPHLQGEFYPALVLFPPGNGSPVTYEGEIAVSSIINFMAEHGSNLKHLISENGKFLSVGENYTWIGTSILAIIYCLDPSHRGSTVVLPEFKFSVDRGIVWHYGI